MKVSAKDAAMLNTLALTMERIARQDGADCILCHKPIATGETYRGRETRRRAHSTCFQRLRAVPS